MNRLEMQELRQSFLVRDRLPSMLNRLNLCGQGVEIGVWNADFSCAIGHVWKGQKLWCVDIWPDDSVFEHARGNLESMKQASGLDFEMIRMPSVEAAKRFDDSSLSWAYIDANHSYASAREDIESWYPKIVDGGILAGHDYMDGTFRCSMHGDEWVYGVKSAVLEFAAEKNRFIYTTMGDYCNSWMIIK